jgi:hypothetical protein
MYQIYSILKQRVADFSFRNWTSSLRQYAKFPICEDGLADFVYEGNQIRLVLSQLGMETNKSWKKVYIEVKSSSREEKCFFHLSDSQFQRVGLFLWSADPQAQELYCTDELYLIVNVYNALSKPVISRVLEDPIKLLTEGKIVFKAQGGVVARWN